MVLQFPVSGGKDSIFFVGSFLYDLRDGHVVGDIDEVERGETARATSFCLFLFPK